MMADRKMTDHRYDLYVKYDDKETPTISVWRNPAGTESGHLLRVDPGKATITWRPVKAQVDKWRFDGIIGLLDPPFSNQKVEEQEIEIEDDNLEDTAGLYSYTLFLKPPHKPRQQHDPQIRNKPS